MEIKYFVLVRPKLGSNPILIPLDEVGEIGRTYIIRVDGNMYEHFTPDGEKTTFPKNLVYLTNNGRLIMQNGDEFSFE